VARREGAKVRCGIVLAVAPRRPAPALDRTSVTSDVTDVRCHEPLAARAQRSQPTCEEGYVAGRFLGGVSIGSRPTRGTALSSTPDFSPTDEKTGIDRNSVDKGSTHLRRLLIDAR